MQSDKFIFEVVIRREIFRRDDSDIIIDNMIPQFYEQFEEIKIIPDNGIHLGGLLIPALQLE
jgi:hypothetical protein